MRAVELGDGGVDHPALVFLAQGVLRREDDTDGEQVIDILERTLLAHHLLPYRIDGFDAGLEGEVIPHGGEALADRYAELIETLHLRAFDFFELLVNLLPGIGVLIFETQVLQFRFDGEQTEAVRQRGVDILGLTGDLVLLLFGLRAEGAHVMEAVGDLDQYHADIVADGKQQLAEVLRLLARLIAEHAAADLGQSVHYLRDLITEQAGDVLYRIVGIFHHIVQQGCTYTRAAQTDLAHTYARDSEGVHDIGFSAQTADAVVRFVCKIERMRDQLRFLTVRGMCIVIQQRVKFALDHQIFLRCKVLLLHIHTKQRAKLQKKIDIRK